MARGLYLALSMKKRLVHVLLAGVLVTLASRPSRADTGSLTRVTTVFEEVQSVEVNAAKRMSIVGLLPGATTPVERTFQISSVSSSDDSAAVFEHCHTSAMLALDRPGRYTWTIVFSGETVRQCVLSRR